MKDYCKILNEIIKAYYDEEYPEYFQDEVYEIFKREGITKGYKAEPIVRCKDCLYYEEDAGDPRNSNCQRLWGGMIDCKPESYCSDGITIKDYKRKMDEVEE